LARSIQNNLIYFSFDCVFFSDKKIKVLKANYGIEGIAVYIYLLCEIYKNGYYLKLDGDYEYIISDDLKLSADKVKEIIEFLTKHYLFDEDLFLSDKILTSKGIQRRFQFAIKEKAKKTPRMVNNYWLLDDCETDSHILKNNSSEKKCNFSENYNNSFTKSNDFSENYDTKKIKEKKENKKEIKKEIKEKENNNKENKNGVVVVVDFYKQNINSDVKDIEISEIQGWLEQGFDESLIIECIKIAVLSNKRSIKYISGILNNMRKNSIMTFEDYQKSERGKKGKEDGSNDQSEQYGNYY